jgi:hypothetical protein
MWPGDLSHFDADIRQPSSSVRDGYKGGVVLTRRRRQYACLRREASRRSSRPPCRATTAYSHRAARSVPAMRAERLAVPLPRGAEGWCGPMPPLLPPPDRPLMPLYQLLCLTSLWEGWYGTRPCLLVWHVLCCIWGARSHVVRTGPGGGRAITQVWPKHGLEPPEATYACAVQTRRNEGVMTHRGTSIEGLSRRWSWLWTLR